MSLSVCLTCLPGNFLLDSGQTETGIDTKMQRERGGEGREEEGGGRERERGRERESLRLLLLLCIHVNGFLSTEILALLVLMSTNNRQQTHRNSGYVFK